MNTIKYVLGLFFHFESGVEGALASFLRLGFALGLVTGLVTMWLIK